MTNPVNFVDSSEIDYLPPLIVGLSGLSNSGKTYSALVIAQSMAKARGGDVYFVDTEGGRAAAYKDTGMFPHLNPYKVWKMEPPFSGDRFKDAIETANKNMAACMIIDSASDEWEGQGGVLDVHDAYIDKVDPSKRDKMNMVAWNHAKKPHKKFMQALLKAQFPVILCLRSVDKMVLDKGKAYHGGLSPICDSRMIYDLTFHLQMDETKKDGSYKVEKFGYEHTKDVFPKGGKIGSKICDNLVRYLSGDSPGRVTDGVADAVDRKLDPKTDAPDEVWWIESDVAWKLKYDGPKDAPAGQKKKTFFTMLKIYIENAPECKAEILDANKQLISTLPDKAKELISAL